MSAFWGLLRRGAGHSRGGRRSAGGMKNVDALGVAASKARLVSGAKSRLKQVGVTGKPDALMAKLAGLVGG